MSLKVLSREQRRVLLEASSPDPWCQTRLIVNQVAVGEKWLQGSGLDTRETTWEDRGGSRDWKFFTWRRGWSSF